MISAANRLGRTTALLAAMLAASWLAAAADTYYVRQSGNDQNDGKTAKTAFKTVQRAAQVLNYGDNVVIGPGTYKENALLAERYAADGSAMSFAGDESGKLTGDPAGSVVIQSANLAFPALRFHRFRSSSCLA